LRLSVASGWMSPGGGEIPKRSTGWNREFEEPIVLPDGRKLVRLRDAADYIAALPAKESAVEEWQAAIEALAGCGQERPHQCWRGSA
jgi:hypothetical protein